MMIPSKLKFTILSTFIISLTGCATNITPLVTGGSKSDGVVTLGYQYGYFQKPNIDMAAANDKALKRCMAWGYSKAEIFDGVETDCFQRNAFGTCLEGRVKMQYQCINSNPEKNVP